MYMEFQMLKTVSAVKIWEANLQRIFVVFWIEICSIVLSGTQGVALHLHLVCMWGCVKPQTLYPCELSSILKMWTTSHSLQYNLLPRQKNLKYLLC